MTVTRTLDATRLNVVANDPAVRPYLGGEGPLDLAPLVSNPANFTFATEHGGFVGIARAPGLYEAHSIFAPDSPKGQAFATMQAALVEMFTATDCVELATIVPAGNTRAAALADAGGFIERFTRGAAWRSATGEMVDASYRYLTIERWALASAECAAAGAKFHDALESAKVGVGSALPVHPDDPAHDAMAGAAMLMVAAGNVHKGVNFYNRWSPVAGYVPVEVISTAPPVVDVRDAIVGLRDGSMEVLTCR